MMVQLVRKPQTCICEYSTDGLSWQAVQGMPAVAASRQAAHARLRGSCRQLMQAVRSRLTSRTRVLLASSEASWMSANSDARGRVGVRTCNAVGGDSACRTPGGPPALCLLSCCPAAKGQQAGRCASKRHLRDLPTGWDLTLLPRPLACFDPVGAAQPAQHLPAAVQVAAAGQGEMHRRGQGAGSAHAAGSTRHGSPRHGGCAYCSTKAC